MSAQTARRITPRPRRAAPPSPPGEAAPGFYRPQSYQPEESIGYLMKRIMSIVGTAADHELEPTGLTHAQWLPLLKLYMGHASTVAELARESQLDVGAMTRTLDRLEAMGLLKRVRSSDDRRVVNLELTAEGRATAKKIPAALCKVQNAHLRGFTEDEWKLLKSMLRRILQNAIDLQAERESKR